MLVNDFYRLWKERRGEHREGHFILAGRLATVPLGLALFAMSILCYYWQRTAFAYSGLLGVYFTAVFTKRGSSASVIAALIGGFLTILSFQGYVVDMAGLPVAMNTIAFPWQLCIWTAMAIAICLLGSQSNLEPQRRAHV